MQTKPHELTNKLLAELGVKDADPGLAEQVEENFAAVILEVLLREMPQKQLPALRAKIESDAADLDAFVAEAAASVPGLAAEMEAALLREYEIMKSQLKPRS